MKNCLFIAFATLLIFSSCRNDLELNAPYKEIPSIYAVLNPNDQQHTIRINKVFLGEGDANLMAKVADSVNYPEGELEVTLSRLDGDKIAQVIKFGETLIQTEPGAFSQTQRVYTSEEKLLEKQTYRLTVKNLRTGNIFTAKATSLDSARETGFVPFSGPYYPVTPGAYDPADQNAYIDYSVLQPKFPYNVRVKVQNDISQIYNLVLRLHFYDSMGVKGNNYLWVDFPFSTLERKLAASGGNFDGYLSNTFRGEDLFSAVGYNLSRMGLSDNIVGRKMYKIQYLVYSSTQDYIDFLQYSSPSLSLAQNKPLYSNFENRAALGIFTFRSRSSYMKEMSSGFVSEFARNRSTCGYRFFTSAMEMPGCR